MPLLLKPSWLLPGCRSAKDTGLAVIVLGPPDAHAVAKRMHRVAHWYKPLHAFLEDNTEPKRGYHGTSGSETGGGSVEEYATPAVSRIPGVGDFAEVDATRHANRDGGGSRESGRRSGNESGSGGGEKGGADGGVAGNRIGIRGAGDVMGDGTGGTGRDGGVDMSRGPKEKEEDGGERQAHGRGGAEAGGVEKGKQETGLGEAMALAREDERGIRRGAGWLSCFGRKKVAAV